MSDSDFNLSGFSEEEIKNSGFKIVSKIWKKDNPEATEVEKAIFVSKFFKNYNNRPTRKKGKPSGTVSDPLVSELVASRIKSSLSVEEITKLHRASMQSENIIGALLEEYIHKNSVDLGWACCWGATIKATDFVSKKGDKLQIKNKTNTENSSSNKIREGKNIDVWYRMNAYTGQTYWDELNSKLGHNSHLSEDNFQKFAKKAIKNNPEMLNLGES